ILVQRSFALKTRRMAMLPRRQFLGMSGGLGAGLLLPAALLPRSARAQDVPLLDPMTQPRFVNQLPNPLAPSSIYLPTGIDLASGLPRFDVQVSQITHDAGLIDPVTGRHLRHTAWAYGTP